MAATRNAIFEESQRDRRKRDAPPQARHAAVQFRRQGHQPQAGHRDRAERGARQRRARAQKAVRAEEISAYGFRPTTMNRRPSSALPAIAVNPASASSRETVWRPTPWWPSRERPGGGVAFLAGRRPEVEDREAPARLERRQQARVHRRRIAEVMVDVAHHDGVAACVGEVGARRGAPRRLRFATGRRG